MCSFFENFLQLAKILHDWSSRRWLQISALSKSSNRFKEVGGNLCKFKETCGRREVRRRRLLKERVDPQGLHRILVSTFTLRQHFLFYFSIFLLLGVATDSSQRIHSAATFFILFFLFSYPQGLQRILVSTFTLRQHFFILFFYFFIHRG